MIKYDMKLYLFIFGLVKVYVSYAPMGYYCLNFFSVHNFKVRRGSM